MQNSKEVQKKQMRSVPAKGHAVGLHLCTLIVQCLAGKKC